MTDAPFAETHRRLYRARVEFLFTLDGTMVLPEPEVKRRVQEQINHGLRQDGAGGHARHVANGFRRDVIWSGDAMTDAPFTETHRAMLKELATDIEDEVGGSPSLAEVDWL